MIDVQTLGTIAVRAQDGRPALALLAQPKRLALFVYVAVGAPSAAVQREALVALFWPELDQFHARAALRQAVHGLQTALGGGVLRRVGNEILGLTPDAVRCDVHAFDAYAKAGRLEDALALYRGDFLEGFHLAGAPEFQWWIDAQRARLRERAAEAAWRLAEMQQHTARESAGRWARWAAAHFPHHEPTLCRLIEFLARIGDRVGAVRAYRQFERRVVADLDVAPSHATRALVAAVSARSARG